jgi:hypothetical protein
MSQSHLTWTAFLACDVGALAFILRFVRWSSIELNYTDKGVSFMYFLHLCLRIVTRLVPAVFLKYFSRLSKIYTEQYVICTLIHRMVPPRIFMSSEVYSLIMNTYVGIIVFLYVSIYSLSVPEFLILLIELYQFFIATTAFVGMAFFCWPKKTSSRHKHVSWTPSTSKQLRNTLVSALYVLVTAVVYFLSQRKSSDEILLTVVANILGDYVFMAAVLGLILGSTRMRRKAGDDIRSIPLV